MLLRELRAGRSRGFCADVAMCADVATVVGARVHRLSEVPFGGFMLFLLFRVFALLFFL